MPASHHSHPERAERTDPLPRLIKHGTQWKKNYPPEWRETITRIALLQEQLQDTKKSGKDWTDAELCEGQVMTVGVWASMRTGSYPVPKGATTLSRWSKALSMLETHAKASLKRIDAGALTTRSLCGYIERPDYSAIKLALERAQKRASSLNPDRVVGYVADTGCGKTAMIQRLKEEGLVDWSMESAPSSFKAFLVALADMWELPIETRVNTDTLRSMILKHAKTLPGIFILDEIDTLDRRSLVLVKQLLNESTLVVGLFMTPETYEGLKHMSLRKDKQGSQLKQIFRRFEALITASQIEPKEVAAFMPEVWGSASKEQLSLVAKEANLMGGIDAVRRIASNVSDLGGIDNGSIPEETFTRALRLYRMAVPTGRAA